MTEQTPLERLEEAIEDWEETEVADFDSGDRVVKAALAYRDHAEAMIKELEVEMEKLIPLVALQAEIYNLKEILKGYKESHNQIHNIIYCIGGPLNDNKLLYSKEQRTTFHKIAGELIDPCNDGCECPCH